jgi:hypothetical protein
MRKYFAFYLFVTTPFLQTIYPKTLMKRLLLCRLGYVLLSSIVAIPVMSSYHIAIAQSQASSLAYLNGTWEGTYRCLQGLAKLKLDIQDNSEQDIDAIFSFSEHPTNQGVPSGRFKMKGRYAVANTSGAAGILDLDATSWIQRPRRYQTVYLYGNIAASKDIISGAVQSSGCTNFEVSKLSTQKSESFQSPIVSRDPAPQTDVPLVSITQKSLDGPERQVESYHKAMETSNTDKIYSHFCAAERTTAKTIEETIDPKGRNRTIRDIYLAMARGLYRLDTSQLVYKTVYTDAVGEGRAVVTVAGPVLLHGLSGKSTAIMYHRFQPLGKAWIRLIRENGQWKLCQN